MFKPSRIPHCIKLFQNPLNPQRASHGPSELHFYAGQLSDNSCQFSDVHRQVSNAIRQAITNYLTQHGALDGLQLLEITTRTERSDELLEVRFHPQICLLAGDDTGLISQLRLHRDETHSFENSTKMREYLQHLIDSSQLLVLSWLQEAYCNQQECVASFILMDTKVYHTNTLNDKQKQPC